MELENLIVRGSGDPDLGPDFVLQEKMTEEYFETFIADPDNTIRTCTHIQIARAFKTKSKAREFMYENNIDNRFKVVKKDKF